MMENINLREAFATSFFLLVATLMFFFCLLQCKHLFCSVILDCDIFSINFSFFLRS